MNSTPHTRYAGTSRQVARFEACSRMAAIQLRPLRMCQDCMIHRRSVLVGSVQCGASLSRQLRNVVGRPTEYERIRNDHASHLVLCVHHGQGMSCYANHYRWHCVLRIQSMSRQSRFPPIPLNIIVRDSFSYFIKTSNYVSLVIFILFASFILLLSVVYHFTWFLFLHFNQ